MRPEPGQQYKTSGGAIVECIGLSRQHGLYIFTAVGNEDMVWMYDSNGTSEGIPGRCLSAKHTPDPIKATTPGLYRLNTGEQVYITLVMPDNFEEPVQGYRQDGKYLRFSRTGRSIGENPKVHLVEKIKEEE